MATTADAKLTVQLPTDFKELIEEAAAAAGQSVSDYLRMTIIHHAQAILQQRETTALSDRDREAFMALLDDSSARPNQALKTAAKHYRKRIK